VPLQLEATVPVRLRLGSVLRTWTLRVRVRCDLSGVVAGAAPLLVSAWLRLTTPAEPDRTASDQLLLLLHLLAATVH
jgi:hypothetical protein